MVMIMEMVAVSTQKQCRFIFLFLIPGYCYSEYLEDGGGGRKSYGSPEHD